MTKQLLSQNISTNLKLSTSLKQSIEMLQFSAQELEALVNQQIIDNPLLLIKSSENENDEAPIGSSNYNSINDKKFSKRGISGGENYDIIDNIRESEDLKSHLRSQLKMLRLNRQEYIAACYIIDLADDNGYLINDEDELATSLGVTKEFIVNILQKLYQLEPAGVFAKNLQHCLELQLKDKQIYDKAYEIILLNLPLVANGLFDKLAKLASLKHNEIMLRIKLIKNLEPKPGRNFSETLSVAKIPDVIVHKITSNDFAVEVNDDVSRPVIVNREYYNEIRCKIAKIEERKYLSTMLKDAVNTVKAIEHRQKTILTVAQTILVAQEEFFRNGIMFLKPLTLSVISEITGFNESTISRATANKYIGTPYGVFEMKYFFSSSVKSKYSSSENISSRKVKELIKSIIEEEDPAAPLADEEIMVYLQQFSVSLARRTVTKYRESMRISSSNHRKRSYKISQLSEA